MFNTMSEPNLPFHPTSPDAGVLGDILENEAGVVLDILHQMSESRTSKQRQKLSGVLTARFDSYALVGRTLCLRVTTDSVGALWPTLQVSRETSMMESRLLTTENLFKLAVDKLVWTGDEDQTADQLGEAFHLFREYDKVLWAMVRQYRIEASKIEIRLAVEAHF